MRLGPVELLEHARRGSVARAARRRARRRDCRCRRTSHEPLADPERYQTVYARDPGLGRRADRRAPLHARAARAPRRTSASRSTSASTRSGRSRPRRSRSTSSTASATASSRRPGSGSRRPSACSRSGRRRRASSRRSRAAAPLAGRTDALHHARLRLPARRRAADELPPAADDAARARDGVRGHRGDAASSTRSRSRERYRFYSFGDAMLVL